MAAATLALLGCAAAPTTPPTGTTPAADPAAVTLIAAGDIARCDSSGDEATADLVETLPGTVLTLGDNVYEEGTSRQFAQCYDPSWGRFLDRTLAVPGNHDHETPGAAGYYAYFGPRAGPDGQGWYAQPMGEWRLITLDSQCDAVGGCGPESPQGEWLAAELRENPSACTVVAFHRPRFSSGLHGSDRNVEPLWRQVIESGADVILHGHEHSYERLGPVDVDGRRDASGATVFIVGTGGAPLRGFEFDLRPSRRRIDDAHGVLVLNLTAGGFQWAFRATPDGRTLDSGSGQCR